MNILKASREEIRIQLRQAMMLDGSDIMVYDHIPARLTPPSVVIEPGEPYMTQGSTFDMFNVSFQLLLLVGVAQNKNETDALDELICSVVDAVETWYIDNVEPPSAYEINGNQYLGTRIALTADKKLI
jgi:hypothetical protein